MERNFHNDFQTSRTKLETQRMRRLSVQHFPRSARLVTTFATPRSSAATPRRWVSPSFRRTPDISSFSTPRRNSVWSLPETLTQTKFLKNGWRTYGGSSARLPSESKFYERSSVTASKVTSVRDFCDKMSVWSSPSKPAVLWLRETFSFNQGRNITVKELTALRRTVATLSTVVRFSTDRTKM